MNKRNWRQVVAGWISKETPALPAVEIVRDENCVVVLKTEHWLSANSALRLKRIVESAFNAEGRAVLVMDGGMDIAVFRKPASVRNNIIVITRNATGEIVMVSRQDEDGEIQDVIATAYNDEEREAHMREADATTQAVAKAMATNGETHL